MERMRLNKYLAHAGVCSRRDADALIARGQVLVDGQLPTPGCQVGPENVIMVSGKVVQQFDAPVVLAFYKPVGVTCTEKDPHAERVISDLVKYPRRVTYAGRLDKDSEGLLLLTDDGDLIQAMMKGSANHEKEYVVRVEKEISADFVEKMGQGVYLEDLGVTTKPCKIERIGKYTFRIVLTQGLNRQIRRMVKACGNRVTELKRERVMYVTLGKLKPGEYRELSKEDVERLYRDCGLAYK